MELTSLERDMLEGKHGEGVALAMKVQVGTGKAFYAKRMVPITRAHVAASAQEGDLYFVTKLVDAGARCVVSPDDEPQHGPRVRGRAPLADARRRPGHGSRPATTAYRAHRRDHDPELHAGDREERAVLRRDRGLLGVQRHAVRQLGARARAPTASPRSAPCAPPSPGACRSTASCSTRTAAARCSSRSRRTSRTTSTGACSATPTRRSTRARGARCSRASRRARPRRASCSSAPSSPPSGSVAMYHIVGITPGGADRRGGLRRQRGQGARDDHRRRPRARARAVPRRAGPDRVRHVRLPAPHHPPGRRDRRARSTGKRFAVDTWILVSSLTLELAERMGYLGAIQRAGGHVIADTCMDVPGLLGHLLRQTRASPSRRSARSTARCYGQRFAVRPLAQAVASRLAGEVV